MTQSAPSQTNFGMTARWAVIGLGVVVCSLMFFADKSNLENDAEAGLRSAPVQASSSEVPSLPPVEGDEPYTRLQIQLREALGEQQVILLDSISQLLSSRGRMDLAAVYARDAANLAPNTARELRAGILAQQALDMPVVQEDPDKTAWFAGEAISRLETVVEQQPGNEEALLALGLSYVYSGVPENSMKGIMTIRRVLELNPDNINASLQLGYFSMQTGQFDKAVERFEQVLSINSDRQDARLGLAEALINLNRPSEAIPLLETVVQQSTDNKLRLQAGGLLDNIR